MVDINWRLKAVELGLGVLIGVLTRIRNKLDTYERIHFRGEGNDLHTN